jgi:metal-responsive CopG/Arc/MetJ family transcriptional regulator
MKTAISVADRLMQEADRAAKELGVSRSRVFSIALENYLRARRDEKIAEQLDRVYGSQPDPGERRTVAKLKSRFRATIKDRW